MGVQQSVTMFCDTYIIGHLERILFLKFEHLWIVHRIHKSSDGWLMTMHWCCRDTTPSIEIEVLYIHMYSNSGTCIWIVESYIGKISHKSSSVMKKKNFWWQEKLLKRKMSHEVVLAVMVLLGSRHIVKV